VSLALSDSALAPSFPHLAASSRPDSSTKPKSPPPGTLTPASPTELHLRDTDARLADPLTSSAAPLAPFRVVCTAHDLRLDDRFHNAIPHDPLPSSSIGVAPDLSSTASTQPPPPISAEHCSPPDPSPPSRRRVVGNPSTSSGLPPSRDPGTRPDQRQPPGRSSTPPPPRDISIYKSRPLFPADPDDRQLYPVGFVLLDVIDPTTYCL
ncbi:Os05g0145900, partial [Oryza sativa Japonica Group]